VKLKDRAPGQYTFRCPECGQQATVAVPEDASARVVARPIKSLRSSEPASPKVRPLGEKAAPAPTSRKAADQTRGSSARKSPSVKDGREGAGRGPTLRAQADPKRIDPFQYDEGGAEGEPPDDAAVADDVQVVEDEWDLRESGELAPLPAPVRKRKPKPKATSKPRGRKKEVDASQFLAPMLLVGAIWLVLVVVAVFFHAAVYAILVIGSIVTFTGRRLFLRVAREEGVGTWLACLFVPFYSVYYFFTHVSQTIRPFLIGCCGYVFLASGTVLWFYGVFADRATANARDRGVAVSDEDDAEDGEEKIAQAGAQKTGLVLTVAGKELSVPIEQMNYFHVKRNRETFPDGFELSGAGTSIRGRLELGFEEEWEKLVGKPLKVLARSSDPDEGDSEITLPGRGQVKVTGGSLTVEKVIAPRPSPVLRGRIRLETAGAHGTETLEGTFQAPVDGSY
jgi:hypothetical protein